ncbi:GspH/FimT family pseudopilin [Hydrogenophaga sp.]|uniref:GspH/FimT family pseudopilin n=1 Tax=Hydrogenophaga sp. TaxID=1904254 RepID=UPI003F6BC7AE
MKPKKLEVTKKLRGFTLVELMTVVAILAVILSLAFPSMARLLEGTRLRTLSNDWLDHLRLTRSEAIRRGQRVVMCAAASDSACSAGSGWHQGWLVFEDTNNNAWLDGGEAVVRYRQSAPTGWSMTGNTPVARYVSYDPLGATRMINGAFQAGTVTICRVGATGAEARRIAVNSVGRPRSQAVILLSCP